MCIVVLALGSAAPASAQGLSNHDRKAVGTLPDLGEANSVREGQRPALVDLRDHLPPVGHQSMNDCAAWAFGYAARTYLEAVDQGWSPNSTEHIFSPTFIYNQVNHGEDAGSNPSEVIALLEGKGAATLATLPYRPNDFRYAPPTPALDEARVFPIEGAYLLHDGEEIRDALAHGNVVVIGVRTNPVFNSGRYALYTAEMHESARLARKPDQPHGYHAMVICGYSDDRRAFLFMNSWGTGWGEGGFVWISYDVVDVFNGSSASENLMDFAVVLMDRHEIVSREDGHFRPVAAGDLAARPYARFAGLDEQKQPRYSFVFELLSPEDVRESIESVTWTYHDKQGDHALTSRFEYFGYSASGTTDDAALVFSGRVAFKNGTTKEVRGALKAEGGQARRVELGRVDQFQRFDPVTHEPEWFAAYYPVLCDRDWKDLETVDYSGLGVDPQVAVYWHTGRSQGSGLADRSVIAKSPVKGVAKFTFKDGTVYDVALPEGPFTSLARDEGYLTTVLRPEGTDAGREWYFYEVELHVPHAWGPSEFADISFQTGSSYDPEEHSARLVDDHGVVRYVYAGFTDLPLQASANLTLRSRDPNDGRNGGPPIEIRLGNEPVPDTSRGHFLAFTDEYVGLVDGAPTWEFHVKLYRMGGVPNLKSVNWHVPPGAALVKEPASPEDSGIEGLASTSFSAGAEPFEVSVDLVFADDGAGTRPPPLTVRRTLQPSTRPNDALGLIAVHRIRERASKFAPVSGLAETYLSGPRAVSAGVRSLESLYRTPWGAQDRMRSDDTCRLVPLAHTDLRAPHPELAAPAEAIVTFEDESRMYLSTGVRPDSPFVYPNRLQLEARERFLGYEDRAPRWAGTLRVAGDLELVRAIESVTYRASAIDGRVVPVTSGSIAREASVETGEPLRLRADVVFTAASGFVPMVVETQLRTAAERTPDELAFAVDPLWQAPFQVQPGDTIADIPIRDDPMVMHLVGHTRALARVRSVDYEVRNADEPESTLRASVESRRLEEIDGFPAHAMPLLGKSVFTALVHLADGSTRTFSTEKELEFEPAQIQPLQCRQRYWGEEQGQDAYLISYRVLPSEERIALDFWVAWADTQDLWGSSASYARPSFPWDYVAWGKGHLKRVMEYEPTYPGSTELASRELDLDPAQLAPLAHPPAAKVPRLEVLPDPARHEFVQFVRVVASEKLLARVRRVEYDVEQAGQKRTLRPFDRIGETGDSFDCRIVGPAPTRIVARLVDAAGGTVGEALTWNR
ncbi:MAG: C1 family peptidase [Planctomycetes bacterium]|nr:C1 family peptidase [Planctomycetota bacterium]